MRNSTIDIAKGIGILLIVFGHNWIVFYFRGELFDFIYSFQVLLFFFLAGVLYKQKKDFSILVTSKADSLLKPYFVVLFGLGLIKILLRENLSIRYFLGVLYGNGNTIEWAPLWFLPHLFMVFIFLWAVIKVNQQFFKNSLALWGLVALFLLIGDKPMQFFWLKTLPEFWGFSVLFGQPAIMPGLPFSLDLILITLGYTLIGYLTSNRVMDFKINYFGLCISLMSFLTLQYYFNDSEDLNLRIYENVLVCAVQAISAFYIILCFSDILGKWTATRQALGYIGSASLVILLFHAYIQDATYNLLETANPTHPIRHGFFSLIAAIGSTLILNYIIKSISLLSRLLLPIKHKTIIDTYTSNN